MTIQDNNKGGYIYTFKNEDLENYGLNEELILMAVNSPFGGQLLLPRIIEALKKVDAEYGTSFCGNMQGNKKKVNVLLRIISPTHIEVETEIDETLEDDIDLNNNKIDEMNHSMTNNPFMEILKNIVENEEKEKSLKTIKPKEIKQKDSVLEFNNINDIINICHTYNNMNYIRESVAYKYNNKYYLVLPNITKKDEYLFLEFIIPQNSKISKTFIEEHGIKLSKENAIIEFSKL